jgi:hypothetical protein
MPGGDRTGPAGMGPMSGGAAGFCAGFDVPGFANRPIGRGFGRGFGAGYGWHGGMNWGGGRGWRHTFWATGLPGWLRGARYYGPEPTTDPAFEKQSLKNQEAALQAELDMIKKRLSELETPDQSA